MRTKIRSIQKQFWTGMIIGGTMAAATGLALSTAKGRKISKNLYRQAKNIVAPKIASLKTRISGATLNGVSSTVRKATRSKTRRSTKTR